MPITSQQKGKLAEFLVFGELIKRKVDVFLPIIDTGINAVVRREDGTYLDIQVKSTEKDWNPTMWVPNNLQLLRSFFIWFNMSESKENPKIWVFPGRTFMD